MNDVEIEGTAIVFLGGFNPPLFSPAWLRLHGLIGEDESEKAQVQVITAPVAIFSTDWLHVDVRADRLTLSTAMAQETDRLRDLAVSILQILPEIPISALGINRDVHWRAPSESQYHDFGDFLTPKMFWEKNIELPGMVGLQIQGARPDDWAGAINVLVQPSNLIKPLGIFAQVNDHFWLRKIDKRPTDRSDIPELSDQNTPPAAERDLIPLALEIIGEMWNARLAHSERILRDLISLSRKTG